MIVPVYFTNFDLLRPIFRLTIPRAANTYCEELDGPWPSGADVWTFEEHLKGRLNISLDGNAPSFEEIANHNSRMEQDCDSVDWYGMRHHLYAGNISLHTQLMNRFNPTETF